MLVFVINKHDKPLMPCKQQKARKLLTQGKAVIVSYKPFTVKLLYGSSGYVQPVAIGIDTGAKCIGVAITSNNKVLAVGEIELRQDVKANLQTRKEYRRGRRYRKTRYRQPRFLNRGRKSNWPPPSIQSRINNTFFWIDRFTSLLPDPTLHIEVGKFDMAKMINPDIGGVEYQQGDSYGFYATRYFVFARDNYTCQVCGESGKILITHHIVYKPEGSDRADNLITVCVGCHTGKNHQLGGILYKWQETKKKVRQYKEPPFMNSLRIRVYQRYPDAEITYGNITTVRRRGLGIQNTHINDAIAISGVSSVKTIPDEMLFIKQFRKKKRSLHEATPRRGRIKKNTTQKRNEKNKPFYKGFYLGDRVRVLGQVGYISGFTKGGVYVKRFDDTYITLPNKTYKQLPMRELRFISHCNNWQLYIRPFQFISPPVEAGDFLAI